MPGGVRGKALPDDLLPILLKMRGEGKNAEELAVWLKETHNIEITPQAIRKRFARITKERSEITQQVIADKVGRTAAADLDEVGKAIYRALEDELLARDSVVEVKEVLEANPETGKMEPKVVRMHEPGSESWSRIMHVVSKSRGDLGNLLKLRLAMAGADANKRKADPEQVTEDLLAKVDNLLGRVKSEAETKPTLQ